MEVPTNAMQVTMVEEANAWGNAQDMLTETLLYGRESVSRMKERNTPQRQAMDAASRALARRMTSTRSLLALTMRCTSRSSGLLQARRGCFWK